MSITRVYYKFDFLEQREIFHIEEVKQHNSIGVSR